MNRHLDLTAVANLVGDPSRLKMLAALLAEGELSAGDLAAVAGVSKQTASRHLERLKWGDLVVRVSGAYGARHRVFRLVDDDVCRAVAAVAALATVEPRAPLMTNGQGATTCYGHLGGTLGKTLLGALLDRGLLEPVTSRPEWLSDYRVTDKDFFVTDNGAEALRDFGIDIAGLQKQRRNFARCCLNTHEASAHLSGSLADALLKRLLERQWVVPHEGDKPTVQLTEAGRSGLAETFGVKV